MIHGRRAVVRAAWVALVLGLCSCGKDKAVEPAAAADTTAAAQLPEAATPTVAAPTAADRAKLALWFAPVRCQALGMALPNPRIYAEAGYGSAAEFAAAFDAAAASDPAWAKQVVAKAYATPCPEAKAGASALATPPTADTGESP